MKATYYLVIMGFAIFVGACSNQKTKGTEQKKAEHTPVNIKAGVVTDVTMNDSLEFLLMRRGKKIAHESGLALKKKLKKAIKEQGIEEAISFCSTEAMVITDSVSEAKQVYVQRLAKKYRNPQNNMLGNDSILFKSYIVSWLNSGKLLPTVSWDTLGQPTYYQPIYVEALCLNCHGSPNQQIAPNVGQRIAQLYPDDKAVNFKEGQLRGMWKVTFPEYRVVNVDLSNQSQ